MTPLELYCAITQTINAITSLSIGLYVLTRNPRAVTNRSFAAFAISAGLWSAFYIPWVMSREVSKSLFWNRMLMTGCVPIPSFFLHFVISLLGMNLQKRRILRFSYVLSTFIFLSIPTPLLVASVSPKTGFHFWANPGPLFFVYMVHFMACFFYTHLLMYRELKTATGNRRNQIKYLSVGTFVALLGGSTNFPLWFNIPIPPVGNALVAAYVVMVAYTILQHHLMDINVVIRKSLVYSLLVTVLTASYFGLVYGVERIFQTTLGYHSTWISLLAFALMALLFQPLKVEIQRLVDWLIFRVPQEALVKRVERLEEQVLQAEKLKAISTLAAGMAHEIKNPLTALKTFGEFIPEKGNDPEFLKKLHEIFTTETQRIHNIVQEVLEFAKPKLPQLKPVEMSPLIHSTVNLLSADLTKQNIRWEINCQHNGFVVQADLDQIRQVLINLIQNAADAMPNGGTLTLTTKANDGHLELAITDTGEGIPKELLPKIFDPFVTTKPNGTGLGLAMVQTIIRAHHGSISAASTPTRGTTFTLRFPL